MAKNLLITAVAASIKASATVEEEMKKAKGGTQSVKRPVRPTTQDVGVGDGTGQGGPYRRAGPAAAALIRASRVRVHRCGRRRRRQKMRSNARSQGKMAALEKSGGGI